MELGLLLIFVGLAIGILLSYALGILVCLLGLFFLIRPYLRR